MTTSWIRASILSLLAVAVTACGGSTPGPSPVSSLDLNGTWSGMVGAGSGGGNALRVTWTASQAGSNLSGPVTLLTSPAVTGITFSGTLTGSLTGSQLALTYSARAEGAAGSTGCTASGSGSAIAGSSLISGTLAVSFVSCEALGLQPPARNELALTKP
jgi:hypothetical protein